MMGFFGFHILHFLQPESKFISFLTIKRHFVKSKYTFDHHFSCSIIKEKIFPKMLHKIYDIIGFIDFCDIYCSHNIMGSGAKKFQEKC